MHNGPANMKFNHICIYYKIEHVPIQAKYVALVQTSMFLQANNVFVVPNHQ